MSDPRYIVGIDLGTTHCVLTYTSADVSEKEPPEIHLFEIPQVVSAGEVQAQPLLPSFLLLPGPHDVPDDALALPWNAEADWTVGVYARERGAELPTRLVSSAKSVAEPHGRGQDVRHPAVGGHPRTPAASRPSSPPYGI